MNKALNNLKGHFACWADLEKKIEDISSTVEKGDTLELFAKFYLLIKKDFYEIKDVYMRKEIPEVIKKKLKLEETDHGVDGVYVRNDGKIVAYQVKFRSGRQSPTYSELATFWTESEHADYRLIITNALKLPVETERRKKQMAVLGSDLDNLDNEFFKEMQQMVEGHQPRKKTIPKPRDYQKEIIENVLRNFQDKDRGKVIAACGTGKTLISKWIHDEMKSQYTLFTAPSLSLIKQTIEEWTNKTDKPFTFLAVCSDQTVVTDITEDTMELNINEVNFPVTTDPDVILQFIKKPSKYPKVIFSTYQSVDAIMNALLKLDAKDFSFDLALYDESHRTAGTKESPMFIYALEDRFIPVKHRLFLTATERVITRRVKKFAEQAGIDVFSMDDPDKYGVTFAELNFGKAIEKGIIADYKVVVCAIDEEELFELAKQNYYVQIDIGDETNTTTMDNLLKQVILARAVQELGIKKVITYHSRVDIARKFIDGSSNQLPLRDVFTQSAPHIKDSQLYLGHVNGSMTSGKRKDILTTFEKSEYGIISNAKCLTEGIDVPAIDAVYFADPKDSTVDIIQAIGRALRKKQNETKTAFILIPVILPKDAKNFSGLKSETFETLHSVIQALRDQDQTLAQIIDEVNYQIATGHGGPRKGRVNTNLQKKVLVLAPNKLKISDFESSLQFRIGELNKQGSNEPPKVIFTGAKGERKSSIKRVFTSMGDYNMDAYKASLVLPTLEKFTSLNDIKAGTDLKINNNNVSHTFRLGAIDKVDTKNYKLTAIGKLIKEDPSTFEPIFQQQLLKYYIFSKETGEFLFPYRAWFQVMQQVKRIRKLDFIYGLYPLKDTNSTTIEKAINQIIYLQETYVDPEILSDDNKEKVLEILNKKFNIELAYKDVWTSRGTSYNQFNYFVKHLLTFKNIFQLGNKKHVIEVIPGALVNINNLLQETSQIEEAALLKKDLQAVRELYVNI